MSARTFLVVGMAGVGKTTFCQRLYSWLNQNVVLKDGLNANITSINLDPAVLNPKMPLTVDIRDTVDYHETMQKYGLGPNGTINTCLNLFFLQWKKPSSTQFTIIDTPGQIESITWSAPGDALIQMFSNVCILYVIDISLCKNRRIFMSNMLFAAAIKCKFQRPVLLVFNKCDIAELGHIKDWIRDFETLKRDLQDPEPDLGSMVLFFEEFYNSLKLVCVSSLTGAGKDEFLAAIDEIFADSEGH